MNSFLAGASGHRRHQKGAHMKHSPTRKLPERPDLNQLKFQAKELLRAFVERDPHAIAEINRFYRNPKENLALHDAQLVLARSYGYESWPKLKVYVDGVTVKRLIDAVRSGNTQTVQATLKLRPELVNTVQAWNNEHRALHYAVLARNPAMVRLLIKFGADPHAGISPHNDATTSLCIAEERGYDEIATILRETQSHREADHPTADQMPPELRQALQTSDEDLALLILERHPEFIQAEPAGDRRTLLHFASALLLPRIAGWLIDHGANVNAQAKDGSTPLDGVGALCSTTERAERMADLVTLLRAKGAAITPRAAIILGDEAFLRRRRAETDLETPQDDQGWLLRVAVDFDQPEILRLLLDWGLDPDARVRVDDIDEAVFTWGMPLYQCARYGKHAMAEMLLKRGADPNAEVYASGTPLSEAYGQRNEKMIALLEQYGGKSTASMAGLYRRKDLAERLLAEQGDNVAEQLLGDAARGGDPEILRMAMERVHLAQGDPRWVGILTGPLQFWNHWIGAWCHHEWDRGTYLTCFKMILDRSGPPNGRLRFGGTVLHEVVTTGDHIRPDERVAFATALLDAGARLDLRDDLLKSTPLGWACRWDREELVRLFLERGADPSEPDAEPWATPLGWAEKKNHDAIVAILRPYLSQEPNGISLRSRRPANGPTSG
jgi:ankyrin repeat protein